MKSKWGLILVGLAMGVAGQSIVWRGDRGITRSPDSETEAARPVGYMQYSGTRNDRGSAVLIGDDVIITAGHQIPPYGATATFTIGGRTYETTDWRLHTKYRRAGANDDLAVGRLVERVTNVEPAAVLTRTIRSGVAVTISGCGGSGPQGMPLQWNWQPLTGTNKLSSVSNTMVKTSFDRPGRHATEYESHLVPGDSGGGIFVFDAGEWQLTGVAVSRSGANYGASSTFVRLHRQTTFIQQSGFSDGRLGLNVSLGDWSASSAERATTVEILNPADNSVLQSFVGGLTPEGGISLRSTYRGLVKVRVRTHGWLSTTLTGVSLQDDFMPTLNVGLVGGDANRDNRVDWVDLNLVNSYLGSIGVLDADVNGDEVVDSLDQSIVQANLGQYGS